MTSSTSKEEAEIFEEFEALGFSLQETGGPNLAYHKPLGDSTYFLVTSHQGTDIPRRFNEPTLLGVYDESIEPSQNNTTQLIGLTRRSCRLIINHLKYQLHQH